MPNKTAKTAAKATGSKATASKVAASKTAAHKTAPKAVTPKTRCAKAAAQGPCRRQACCRQARGGCAARRGKKPLTQRQGFKTNEFVVYPAHGVGQILAIEEQEIAGAQA